MKTALATPAPKPLTVPGFTLRITKEGREGIKALQDFGKADAKKIGSGIEGKSTSAKLSWNDVFGQEIFEERQQADPRDQQAAVNTLKDIQHFYKDRYGLGARDGNGPIAVAFDPSFPNAAYTQTRSGREIVVVGSSPTGESFANAPDVLAHEYTHRVVNNIAGLDPIGESGAVNESLADTMAVVYDQRNWTLGEDVMPGGIRDLKNPSRPQDAATIPFATDGYRIFAKKVAAPVHMNNYIDTEEDNGGVHINVGIPNKAAGLIGQTLGRDKMGDIYMGAIKNYLPQNAGIADTAKATLQSTIDQFGARSQETAAVVDAWRSVGLNFSRTRRSI